MTCNLCNIQYAGRTSNTMSTRCRGHESNVRKENNQTVAIHHRSYDHNPDEHNVTIVDKEIDNKGLRLEEAWIILLDTLYPKGLNSRW